MEPNIRTAEEIQVLKDNWVKDPCWDIEFTDGFHDHFNELYEFAEEHRARWRAQSEARERKAALKAPAFPTTAAACMEGAWVAVTDAPGLTMLDYFAAMAMQIAAPSGGSASDKVEFGKDGDLTYAEKVARDAYQYAAAMISERSKYL